MWCTLRNLPIHISSEYFILSAYIVEISRTEGWARKIQIRDRRVTRAIFIENGNNN